MKSVVRTACPRDCPDACGILAHVENGRVTRIQGDPNHPITRGFLCERTSRFLARQYAPDRLTTPLLRKQGSLQPVSWDEALDACAGAITTLRRESGPAALCQLRGGGSLGILKALSDKLFDAIGPVTVMRGSVCDGAGMAAQRADFGDCDSNDLSDLRNARTVVLWGKNPAISSPHLLPLLREIKARGASLVLVDPLRHRTADLCDTVLQPRPGGDLALALGTARVLNDRGMIHPDAATWCAHLDAFRSLVQSRSVAAWAQEAGVSVGDVEILANAFAPPGPTTSLLGWGMQRRTNGSAIVRAIDALAAVTGNLGIPGAGASFYFKRRAAFDLEPLRPRSEPPRSVREAMLAQDIVAAADPPIRMMWISCANPVAMLPESEAIHAALASREFVVVVDSFLTDTARLANVVLPCTTFLEDDDLVGAYGHSYIASVRPAVAPPAGVRSDLAILQALAKRLGLGHVIQGDARAWKQRILGAAQLDALAQGAIRFLGAPQVVFEGRVFPTPSGKVNLLHTLQLAESQGEREFPLRLMALSTAKSQCSQWSPQEPCEPLTARVHPSCCNGIANGSRAFLRSRLGQIDVVVQIDASVRSGLVVVPKGGSRSLGRSANSLVEAELTDDGEGAALYEQPVAIVARA